MASCSNTSIYNRTVTQGTVFKQDDIDRLEIGMSKDQVSFIMGQPSFQNIFDENVWDYYFQVKNGAKIQAEKSAFTPFEIYLYYKAHTMGFPYRINLGENYAANKPLSDYIQKNFLIHL